MCMTSLRASLLSSSSAFSALSVHAEVLCGCSVRAPFFLLSHVCHSCVGVRMLAACHAIACSGDGAEEQRPEHAFRRHRLRTPHRALPERRTNPTFGANGRKKAAAVRVCYKSARAHTHTRRRSDLHAPLQQQRYITHAYTSSSLLYLSVLLEKKTPCSAHAHAYTQETQQRRVCMSAC